MTFRISKRLLFASRCKPGTEGFPMLPRLLVCAALLALLSPAYAQRGEPAAANEEKGPYLGVLFTSVSEALYDQLPQLPRKQGVLVTHVLADSPAAKADIRKSDILLQYDDQTLRHCED